VFGSERIFRAPYHMLVTGRFSGRRDLGPAGSFSRQFATADRGLNDRRTKKGIEMAGTRQEADSHGVGQVPAARRWVAQTHRPLENFSIGRDLMPREMIAAYATVKKAAAIANHAGKRLDDRRYKAIVQVCDEILAGEHADMFPLHVWMTGSGTQFNMNVNE